MFSKNKMTKNQGKRGIKNVQIFYPKESDKRNDLTRLRWLSILKQGIK